MLPKKVSSNQHPHASVEGGDSGPGCVDNSSSGGSEDGELVPLAEHGMWPCTNAAITAWGQLPDEGGSSRQPGVLAEFYDPGWTHGGNSRHGGSEDDDAAPPAGRGLWPFTDGDISNWDEPAEEGYHQQDVQAGHVDHPQRGIRGESSSPSTCLLDEHLRGHVYKDFNVDGDEYVASVFSPGFLAGGDLQVSVDNNRLVISGPRYSAQYLEMAAFAEPCEPDDDEDERIRQAHKGQRIIECSFELPSDANAKALTTELRSGTVYVHLPRASANHGSTSASTVHVTRIPTARDHGPLAWPGWRDMWRLFFA